MARDVDIGFPKVADESQLLRALELITEEQLTDKEEED